MKIVILSRQPNGYSPKRFKEEAKKMGHKSFVLDPLKFSIELEQENPDLYYKGKRLTHYDAVIPRIGASITFYGVAIVRQFEQMGVYCANESMAIERSRNKLRASQILSRYDIGIPDTAFVRDKTDVLPAIKRLGGAPVIIKVLEGTQGVGVILADSVKIAEAIIETLQSAKQNVLIQKFIKESKGKDIRAIVVGDKVIAAMRRRAVGDEFRSNVHRGGTTEIVTLDAEFEHTAIRAAQIMGLRVAGIDMLEGKNGPQVLEVNSSPGLEGIEGASGVNVARAIIEDIEHQVLFPDVDLRQRLRLAAGYGIAELNVHNMPDLEGSTLRDSHLNVNNIRVIHITRNKSVIANPNGDEVIKTGDELLCYGPLENLRGMIPYKKPRKKKKKNTT
jgi:ribosomal protein S6--L-glutamate ligase